MYEKNGDKVYGLLMNDFIYKYYRARDQKITPEISTNFVKEFGSKGILGSIFGNVFSSWRRTYDSDRKATLSEREDLMEAFFGALFEVGNKFTYGTGLVLCQKLFEFIYKDFIIPEEIKDIDTQTYVPQLFETAFGIANRPIISSNLGKEFKGEFKFRLEMTEYAYDMLKENFPELGSKVIAESGVYRSKDSAMKEVYKLAKAKLKEYGITREWAFEFKKSKFLADIKEKDPALYSRVSSKLRRDGYLSDGENNYRFNTSRSTSGLTYREYQLVGIDKKTRRETILGRGSGSTDYEAKIAAIEDYLINYIKI
jgi:hypothetical protein